MSDIRRFNDKYPFSETEFNSRIPRYNDDSDYTTNAPSYYDDLARKNALMKRLALRVWEYQELINKQFDEWDEELRKRFLAWDKNLEEFDDEVLKLLQQWLLDGTLDHIINETIFSWKADKVELDRVERETKEEFINVRKEIEEEIERLENETFQSFKDVRQENEQKDFVDILKRYNEYPYMQLQKINNGNGFEITMYNDQGQQITMQYIYNGVTTPGVKDDYLIHTRTWAGGSKKEFRPYKVNNNFSLVNFTSEPAPDRVAYTTNIGGTVTVEMTIEKQGDGIFASLHTDDRGGIWEFETGDRTTQISTWSSGVVKKDFELFDNMSPGTHTVVGTFIGDDPAHAPRDGISRGWLNSTNYNVFSMNRLFNIPDKTDNELLKPPSNIEFAYFFKPELNNNYEFVPFHGYHTSKEVYPTVIYDGGKIIDFNSMDNLSYIELSNDLVIEQKIYARHPETSNTNQMEITTSQKIKRDGTILIDGRMKVLRPTYFTNSYVIMGVANSKRFNEIQTSFGNIYPNTSDQWLSSDKTTFLTDESDRAESYVFLNNSNHDIAVGFTFKDIKETLRKYENDKDDSDNRTYIQHRDENLVKIYSRLWKIGDNLVPAGYVHRFSGEYIFCNKKNVYDLISLK